MNKSDLDILGAVQETLKRGQNVRFRGTGISMWPFLSYGYNVESAPLTAVQPVGSIVLALMDDDAYSLHRIGRWTDEEVYLTCDALLVNEGPLHSDAVLREAIGVLSGRSRDG